MIKLLKEKAFIIFIATLLIAMLIGMFKVELDNQEKKRKIEEDKLNMSKEELIIFEAEHTRCTRIDGSRPSCWKEKDWDIFFLEYCKRVSCQK